MIWDQLLVGFFFATTCGALAWAWISHERVDLAQRVFDSNMEAYKKVGSWYEKRCAELEQESAVLAAQVIAAGSVPVPKFAMPLEPRDDKEYTYDETGLIRDVIDPREYVGLG